MTKLKDQSGEYPSLSEIKPDEHVGIVKEIFSAITKEYDFLNHFLSLGRDIAWRKEAVRRMRFSATRRLLDIATGTADLAIEAARRHPEIHVTGIDLAPEMLEVGRRKIRDRQMEGRITLMPGDALNLDFPDDHFDVAAVAFGIRNMPDRLRALAEMRRVVCPGGQVMVLEMTLPREGSLLRKLYAVYLKKVLPLLARPFSQHAAAYAYLADSISLFPSPRKFAAMMDEAGLKAIEQHPLTLGVTYLHIGYKN
jgi:demethylmenaquinone methyltransferase / 2-methoxy-6-polyprenyl-1,4-benzoquinol methylase